MHGNVWRTFNYDQKPYGWKGKWTEKGKVGLMEGTHGRSYGLVTVDRSGDRLSLSVEEIRLSIGRMYSCAEFYAPHTKFLVAYTDKKTNLNGYTSEELAYMFATARPKVGIPPNVFFHESFARLLTNQISLL